jgi:hypothetical protein
MWGASTQQITFSVGRHDAARDGARCDDERARQVDLARACDRRLGLMALTVGCSGVAADVLRAELLAAPRSIHATMNATDVVTSRSMS